MALTAKLLVHLPVELPDVAEHYCRFSSRLVVLSFDLYNVEYYNSCSSTKLNVMPLSSLYKIHKMHYLLYNTIIPLARCHSIIS